MSVSQNGPRAATNSAHIYTVADVAAKLNLRLQPNGKYCGAVEGTGTTKDGFVLNPEGNAFTNGGDKFTSAQVAERAGIAPDQYAPYVEFKARNGSSVTSYPRPPKTTPKAVKSPANAPFDWALAQTFDYTDEAGELLYQVGRIGDGAAKRISQRRPDGNDGYIYGLGAGFYDPATRDGKPAWYQVKPNEQPKKGAREFPDVQRVLYQLPDVLRAQTVFICEGEKAVESLNTQLKSDGVFGEIVATTNPHGGGKWHDEFAVALDGKTVCVLPDNDEPGLKHADEVCRSCASAGAVVKRVELPDLPTKGDVADYLSNGGSVENIVALMRAAPVWTPAAPVNEMFEAFTFTDLARLPRPEWLVRGLLVENTISVLSADGGSFKSFFALDMALSVATGTEFHGREVKRGAVVYVAAEGFYTVYERALAWSQVRGVALPENFHILRAPVNVSDAAQVAKFAAQFRELAPVFTVLDTLSQNALGLNENANEEMARFMAGMAATGAAIGAHVMAVHHNAKATGQFRGAGAIKNNVDAHISLDRPDENQTVVFVRCEKQRGRPFEAFALSGNVVETELYDEHGDVVTSLVFEATGAEVGPKSAQHPNAQRADKTRARLLEIFDKCAIAGAEFGGVKIGFWREAVEEADPPICEKRTFWKYRKVLENDGTIEQCGAHNGSALFRRAAPTATTATTAKCSSDSAPNTDCNNCNNPLGVAVSAVGGNAPQQQQQKRAKNSPDAEPYKSATPDNVVGAI